MGMHLVRRPTLTPITVNVNGARDRNRVRDNAASTRDVSTHDLKNKREKGKEEQAIECSFSWRVVAAPQAATTSDREATELHRRPRF